MAVIDVWERSEARSGSFGEKNAKTYTREFRVRTDDAADGPFTVADHIATTYGLIGSTYAAGNDSDVGATLKSVNVQGTADPLVWDVTSTYNTTEGQVFDNPLSRPAEISRDYVQFQTPVTRDIEGVPIVNSADDPFEEPIEKDDSRPVITITRNEGADNAQLHFSYRDAVNADHFMGEDPGTVKIGKISSKRKVEGGYTYWEVTYELHYKEDGWIKKIVDRGYNVKIDDVKYLITDGDGQRLSTPSLLNGSGGLLLDPDAAVPLEFEVYQSKKFAKLGLV